MNNWRFLSMISGVLVLQMAGCIAVGPPRQTEWQQNPCQMEAARLPDGADAVPGEIHGISHAEWLRQSCVIHFRKDTSIYCMWGQTGIYGVVNGHSIDAPIQVDWDSNQKRSPAIVIWLRMGHDVVKFEGHDRTILLTRRQYQWKWAGENSEDRFFIPWSAMGMAGPPTKPTRISLLVRLLNLTTTEGGGGNLVWGNYEEALKRDLSEK